MRSALLLLAACASHEPRPVGPPTSASLGFCAAIAAYDYDQASWAVLAKLESIGGFGDAESVDLVRWWLHRQPCVVEVFPELCERQVHAAIEARVSYGRIRVTINAEGAAGVSAIDDDCLQVGGPRNQKVMTFHFE